MKPSPLRTAQSPLRDPEIAFDPALVEDAVLRAADRLAPSERSAFRAQRDRIYGVADAEQRDAAFRQLHGEWFEKLALGSPILATLRRYEALTRRIARCLVIPARTAGEEGADLHDVAGQGAGRPVLAIRLRASTLLDPGALVPFLHREAMHADDMLDPDFGYDRSFSFGAEPGIPSLIRTRYRVLWDTSVDGRLSAEGLLPEESRAERCRELLGAFAIPGCDAAGLFDRFFRPRRPTHAELLATARHPGGQALTIQQ